MVTLFITYYNVMIHIDIRHYRITIIIIIIAMDMLYHYYY